MKLHITDNEKQVIGGYQHIQTSNCISDLQSIPNNSADNIVANNAIDNISYDKLSEFINVIASKMRFGCQAIIGGIDILALSIGVVNGEISSNQYNDLVYSKKCIYSSTEVSDMIKTLNLQINSIFINGYNYEISFSRPRISN